MSAQTNRAAGSTRGFFHLVYFFLVLMWVVTMALPQWRPLSVLLPFTLLMLAHGVLHGYTEVAKDRGWGAYYLAVQSLLAVGLIWTAGGGLITEALFAPIAGEAVGLFPRWQQRAVALAAVAGSWALASVLTGDPGSVLTKLPFVALGFGFAAIYVGLFVRQSEARQRAEKLLVELEEANLQMRAYARQVEELTVTEERHRMARELHDTLAQGLAGLIMQLEAVDELLDRGEVERARAVVRRASERTRSTLAEARQSIHALRLPLERGDLVEEIRRELDRVRADGGLDALFELGPGELSLDDAMAVQLFRIAREGLNNVLRHARARSVTVRLWSEGERVHLSIADDGVGFEVSAAGRQEGHFGLTGIGERVRLAGGEMSLTSRPGQGATLTVTLPSHLPGGEGQP
ncbi:MAG: sensor histidine kinase [Bacillota bacterium]